MIVTLSKVTVGTNTQSSSDAGGGSINCNYMYVPVSFVSLCSLWRSIAVSRAEATLA